MFFGELVVVFCLCFLKQNTSGLPKMEPCAGFQKMLHWTRRAWFLAEGCSLAISHTSASLELQCFFCVTPIPKNFSMHVTLTNKQHWKPVSCHQAVLTLLHPDSATMSFFAHLVALCTDLYDWNGYQGLSFITLKECSIRLTPRIIFAIASSSTSSCISFSKHDLIKYWFIA